MTSNVNWNVIKVRWESGESSYALAKELPLTKQAVDYRVKSEGWVRKEKNDPVNWVERARESMVPNIRPNGKKSPAVVGTILEAVATGVPDYVAAQAAGVTPKTLVEWKNKDPGLVTELIRARSMSASTCVQRIFAAGDRDWKADAYLLERNPLTRDQFTKQQKDNELPIKFTFERKRAPGILGTTVEGEVIKDKKVISKIEDEE